MEDLVKVSSLILKSVPTNNVLKYQECRSSTSPAEHPNSGWARVKCETCLMASLRSVPQCDSWSAIILGIFNLLLQKTWKTVEMVTSLHLLAQYSPVGVHLGLKCLPVAHGWPGWCALDFAWFYEVWTCIDFALRVFDQCHPMNKQLQLY